MCIMVFKNSNYSSYPIMCPVTVNVPAASSKKIPSLNGNGSTNEWLITVMAVSDVGASCDKIGKEIDPVAVIPFLMFNLPVAVVFELSTVKIRSVIYTVLPAVVVLSSVFAVISTGRCFAVLPDN